MSLEPALVYIVSTSIALNKTLISPYNSLYALMEWSLKFFMKRYFFSSNTF
jgi:hypothetical protein